MKLKNPLILASQSPRRRELLSLLDIPFEIKAADVDETPDLSLSIYDRATDIALRKAKKINKLHPEATILAADTMVFLGDEDLAKPKDEEDAHRMLRQLSGKTHEVITGVALLSNRGIFAEHEVTQVCFNSLSPSLIRKYVTKFSPLDKAGAYGIQDSLSHLLVRKINGSLSNVIGLPMPLVKTLLTLYAS